MNKTSLYLKAIKGVLVISVDDDLKLCCLEDMQKTKYFSIGQLFNAIADINDKSAASYGKLWPKFKDSNNDVSKEWKVLQELHKNCDNDYEFLIEVCKQLQEEIPEVLPRKEVLSRLNLFNQNSTKFIEENM